MLFEIDIQVLSPNTIKYFIKLFESKIVAISVRFSYFPKNVLL